MKRPQNGSTIKQIAYATRLMGGRGSSKKEIAKLSGYSTAVAENAKYKIESTEGYKNAMLHLAQKSNNLLMSIMLEFETRGFKDFSNKDLVSAINAVTGAWDKIDSKRAIPMMKNPETNPLRKTFTERVETRTVTMEPATPPVKIYEQPAESADASDPDNDPLDL